MPLKQYLEFEEIIKNHKEFYNDYDQLLNFTDEFKEDFFNDNLKIFSKYVAIASIIGENEFGDFGDMKIKYTLLGVATEYLLKICAVKINWTEYLEEYSLGKNKQSFEFAKSYVLKNLKDKLNKQQYKRSHEILYFIQTQRNHFAHNPFKGMDHYGVTRQIYTLMLVLVEIYNLNLPEETTKFIIEKIDKHKVISGMDFEDVGFMEYVNRLEESTKSC